MTTEERCGQVVLFDLDGVLVDTDAFTYLVTTALLRRPWRLAPAAALVVARLTLPRYGQERIQINRALVHLALRGLDEPGYTSLAISTGVELGRGASPITALIAEAQRHRDAGSRVIVVTATEHRIARSYLDTVGLAEVELLGTEIIFRAGASAKISQYNIGQQKVSALHELGIDLSKCLLYTDSAADLPLMRRVSAVVLVNPDRSTRRAMDRASLNVPVAVEARAVPRRRPVSRPD